MLTKIWFHLHYFPLYSDMAIEHTISTTSIPFNSHLASWPIWKHSPTTSVMTPSSHIICWRLFMGTRYWRQAAAPAANATQSREPYQSHHWIRIYCISSRVSWLDFICFCCQSNRLTDGLDWHNPPLSCVDVHIIFIILYSNFICRPIFATSWMQLQSIEEIQCICQ